MTPFEEPNDRPPDEALPAEESALLDDRPVRGNAAAAWLVIVIVIAAVVFFQNFRPPPAAGEKRETLAGSGFDLLEFQARYLVGVRELLPPKKADLTKQMEEIRGRSYRDELKIAVLHGEIFDADSAIDRLTRADEEFPLRTRSPEDLRMAALLKRLYHVYAAEPKNPDPSVLSEEERTVLKEELGWFGDLALHPAGGPEVQERREILRRAEGLIVAVFTGVFGGCGMLVLGCLLLIVVLVVMAQGPDRRAFKPGSPHGGVYAETFAVWILAFVGVQLLMASLPMGDSRLFFTAIFSFITLFALAWPVLRGVPWDRVREDVGLKSFGNPFRQILAGPVTYLTSLPLALLGVAIFILLVLLLMRLGVGVPDGGDAGEVTPMHPIFDKLRGADPWAIFQVYFAACVMAPIVEEIFFRGVLHRHLREATNHWGYAGSLLFSGLFGGFLFAVVHPQGLLVVPVLMLLAFGFTLGRERRGSLIPCVIAHAINNGLAVTLAVKLLG